MVADIVSTGKDNYSMNKPKIQVMEAEPKTGENASGSGYKVFNRIIDWITNDRMQLLNITERINADSHMRGMLMGQTLCLQVRNASVLLGTWQNIIFAEFDGPRSRSLAVQVSGV